jgi:hypothetical protein
MKKLTALLSAAAAVVAFVTVGAAPAMAAGTTGTLGADVSYPQCSGSFPGSPGTASPSFGIVGVNNGRPGAANLCLGTEFVWAKGLTSQAPQLYVNTADPGNTVADWPTSSTTTPYGSCTTVKSRGKTVGADSQACAYEYGVEQATLDIKFASDAYASTATWWLDVETANSWLTRSLIGLNQADLLGMVDTFTAQGAAVGAYSTNYQWKKIVGSLDGTAGSTLDALAQWIPTGGSNGSTAQADCTNLSALPSFTGGTRTYVQYTATYDYDIAC